MSDYIVKDTELTSVANAIRIKGGTNSQLVFPNGFVSAIGNISGGGGSSDFSTAEVTFINSAEGKNYKLLAKAFVRVADDETIGENSEVDVSGQKTFKIVIYKGSQFIPLAKFLYYDAQTSPTITGDIEFVTSPSYGFIVSGDGTITAKGTSSAS